LLNVHYFTMRRRACRALIILFLLKLCLAIKSYSYSMTSKKSGIEAKNWEFRRHSIGYEVATGSSDSSSSSSSGGEILSLTDNEPILLLNGFGVGSFHQHRLMSEMTNRDRERSVYAMDYLGQGRSWPIDCDDGNSPNELGLIYSADMWVDQIINFIEEILLKQHPNCDRVHLVGNSVGGYLATVVAAKRPDLVETICLLNATPVWGLNLPFWSGKLPPPFIPRMIGRALFDWIRDLGIIGKYLDVAYSNRKAFGEELIQQIRSCTEGKGGHAAFASILWSPPATYHHDDEKQRNVKDFYQLLKMLKCDVLFVFGQNDPWCKPVLARKMLKSISSGRVSSSLKSCRYLQLSNVGHCPNHEAPQAVAKAVTTWISGGAGATTTQKDCETILDRSKLTFIENGKKEETFIEEWGEISMQELAMEDIQISLMDRLTGLLV